MQLKKKKIFSNRKDNQKSFLQILNNLCKIPLHCMFQTVSDSDSIYFHHMLILQFAQRYLILKAHIYRLQRLIINFSERMLLQKYVLLKIYNYNYNNNRFEWITQNKYLTFYVRNVIYLNIVQFNYIKLDLNSFISCYLYCLTFYKQTITISPYTQ